MAQHGFVEARRTHTAASLVAARTHAQGGGDGVVSVGPTDTLEAAVAAMQAHGISQLPVVGADGEAVGSLTDRHVLHTLVADPEARHRAVSEAMEAPLPVVDGSLALDALLAHLERGPGAVLVRGDGGALNILTRADLLHALAG